MTNEDERYVVVSKASSGDSDYVRAVVHPNEDAANAYLEEVKVAAPWQSHESVTFDAFANAGETVSDDVVVTKEEGSDPGKDEH